MALSRSMLVFDGIKAVPPWDFENERGWTILSGETRQEGEALYFRRVPWLYRAVMDRSNFVSHMPWFITLNGEDYDSLADYQNKLEFFPNPRRLFSLIEQSLCMTGRAYLFKEANRGGYIKRLVYLKPSSVSEVYDQDTGEINAYRRRLGNRELTVDPQYIVAIYGPDYQTEAGPGGASPAAAALMAAGVLFNTAGYVAQFFRRGAIKATVLTAMNTSPQEAERLQHWWEDVVQGVKNAWTAIILRGQEVKPTIIGEGLESLQNDSLTREQRQDIATALGVPESHMWSAAANYATRLEDEKSYYNGTLIPQCDLIVEAFNTQVFVGPYAGYKLEARTETLDIFQADNAEQAAAFAAYVNSGMLRSVAAQVLGIELPSGMEYVELDQMAEEEARRKQEQAMEIMAGRQAMAAENEGESEETEERQPPPRATDQERRSVLNAWRRKAELTLKKTGSPACEFVTTIIPQAHQDAIRAALEGATTQEEIRVAFAMNEPETPDDRLTGLLDRALQILAEVQA